ncbi:glycosyltransferase family 2 protein [Pseudoxanthomonas kaohsiungensis]|uniref:glycosyltransferase family 2 protein n=1 Tax=Pseudoxanthomonas kaohsiungensis TaxID=283923 RepID=UPI0035B4F08E
MSTLSTTGLHPSRPALSPRHSIGVVIPSYKVRNHILDVIAAMGPEVTRIYVVDDCCPDGSGDFVAEHCNDGRVEVLRHRQNQGVGGAVMTGYQAAIRDGIDIAIKIDGDGQMDPSLIPAFVDPIIRGQADYTKGNRFYDLTYISSMPLLRLLGNGGLSFITKVSSGYWDLFDPTNGYTAIHTGVAKHLPMDKISRRYFFETDMLFRLNTLRAAVIDIPMHAKYGDEISGLKVGKVAWEFFAKNIRNTLKRIFYNYYLRGMSPASLELPAGLLMLAFGLGYGSYQWIASVTSGVTASSGTVMLAAMPTLVGIQLLLAFLSMDMASTPKRSIHPRLASFALDRPKPDSGA